jgi:WW domain
MASALAEDETELAPSHATDVKAKTFSNPGSNQEVDNEEVSTKTEADTPSSSTIHIGSASLDKRDVVIPGHDEAWVEEHKGGNELSAEGGSTYAPPLPTEDTPPLPVEAPPATATAEEDDGWAPIWEETSQAFYFYNRFTGATQWHNPRVPEAPLPPGIDPSSVATQPAPPTGRPASGYDPAIHGDYDENAWYAQPAAVEQHPLPATDPGAEYAASANFNRFTGRFQAADIMPENFNDENKSKRQMNAFFDVDAAANSHDGRSLKEERSGKKLSKQELKQFKEKRKAKKEEKRRAWLRD